MKKSIISIIVLLFCINIAIAEQVRVIDKIIIKQVTENRFKQQMPDVSGNNVVWVDYRNGNADIYMKNLVTGAERRITYTSYDERRPFIDGNYILYSDAENLAYYLYDIKEESTIKVPTDGWPPQQPTIHKNKVLIPTESSLETLVYDISKKKIQANPTPKTHLDNGWFWLDLVDYPNFLVDEGVYNIETGNTNKIKIVNPWGIENGLAFGYVSGIFALVDITENQIVKTINPDAIGGLTSAGRFFKNNLIVWDTKGSPISIVDLNTMKKYSIDSNSPTDYRGRFGFDGETIVWADMRNVDKFPLYPETNYDIYVAQIKFKMQEMEINDEPVAPLEEERVMVTEETVVEDKPIKQELSGCTKDSECDKGFCNIETGDCVECYSGKCDCSDGYKACLDNTKCVKIKSKKAGDYYDCEFECKSSLGKNGQCIDPITIELSTAKETVYVGEGTDITISFDNALDYIVEADLTVTSGNGVSISSSEACQSGSRNLCKSFHKIGAKEVKQLSIRVDCIDSIKDIPIKGKITYTAGDLSTTTERTVEIDCVKGIIIKNKGFFDRLLIFLRGLFK